jgi:hypothetical protein
VLTPFLTVLVLLTQAPAPAPASDAAPLRVLIAPPDAAGVPSHLVEFAQEHVAEQLKSRGLQVVTAQDALKKLSVTRRRRLLKCIQTERRCLQSLGDAAKAEVILVSELTQMVGDYRVGAKAYTTKDGALLAESLLPGVREDGMLDALTKSLDVVVPRVQRTMRPGSIPDEPEPKPEPPPDDKPKVVETKPDVKPTPTDPVVTPPPDVPVKPTPHPLRRWAWAPAAGGLVFAGVGTYFLLDAGSKHRQLQEEGSPSALLDGEAIASDGRGAQTLGFVGLGLGVAGLATGAVFYLLPGESAPVRPTASVGPGGGMVGVTGTLP